MMRARSPPRCAYPSSVSFVIRRRTWASFAHRHSTSTHEPYAWRERDTHYLYGNQLSIHLLQLSMLRPTRAPHEDARVHRWARFLAASGESQLAPLAAEDRIMSLAKQKLEHLSQDPATRREARERAEAIKLYDMHLAAKLHAATHAQLDTWADRILTATSIDEVLAP